MSRFTPKILASCVLVGMLASPFSAFATSIGRLDDLPSRAVAYGDLDLNRESGVATLYSRINLAARAVCDPLDMLMLNVLRKSFDCRQAAVARAVADVNSPALTRYYLARNKVMTDDQR
jgi:UrcA family protein